MNAIFHIIDKSNWERIAHFNYYYSQIKCKYNLTSNIDITHLVRWQKVNRYKFFPTMLFVIMKAVNQNKEFRMSFNEKENLVIGIRSYHAIHFFTMKTKHLLTFGVNTMKILTSSIAP